MDKSTDPLDPGQSVQRQPHPARGMMSRIRKASGGFDFSALIGGNLNGGALAEPEEPLTKEAPKPPVPYNPLSDSDAPLSYLEIEKRAQRENVARSAPPKPAWERGRGLSPPPLPAGVVAPEDQDVGVRPNPGKRPRHRGRRQPYLRGFAIRLVLCIWTILIGGCIGIGAGPALERLTEIRVLPASPPKSSKPAPKPAASGSRIRSRRSARRSRKPSSAGQHALQSSKKTTEARGINIALYQQYLTVPAIALAVLSFAWIIGIPSLTGPAERPVYVLVSISALGASAWIGAIGIMITLELKARSTPVIASLPIPNTTTRQFDARASRKTYTGNPHASARAESQSILS